MDNHTKRPPKKRGMTLKDLKTSAVLASKKYTTEELSANLEKISLSMAEGQNGNEYETALCYIDDVRRRVCKLQEKSMKLNPDDSAVCKSINLRLFSSVMKLEKELFSNATLVGTETYPEFLESVADYPDSPVKVIAEPEAVKIQMPLLHPLGMYRPTPATDLLYTCLLRNPLEQWDRWHASITCVYPVSDRNRARDADNFSIKRVVDLIASALRSKDLPGHFSYDMRVEFSNAVPCGTYILVTPETEEQAGSRWWEAETDFAEPEKPGETT